MENVDSRGISSTHSSAASSPSVAKTKRTLGELLASPSPNPTDPAASPITAATLSDNNISPIDYVSNKRLRGPDGESAEVEVELEGAFEGVERCLEQLEPFSFLITSSPENVAFGYSPLLEWLEGAINADFTVADRPFALEIPDYVTKKCREEWLALLAVLRDPDQLRSHWKKSLAIDSVLVLRARGRDAGLHARVWWIREAERQLHTLKPRDPIAHTVFALTLELWHRFVWARYTLQVHARLTAAQDLAALPKDTAAQANEPPDEGWGEVLEVQQLGEGEESEAESCMDDDSGSEMDASDAGNSGEEGDPMDESGSDSADGEEDAEDDGGLSDEDLPHVVPLFFAHAGLAEILDGIEALALEKSSSTMNDVFEWPVATAYARLSAIFAHEARTKTDPGKVNMDHIRQAVSQAYKMHSIPFLRSVGVRSNDELIWKWDLSKLSPNLLQYVDIVYVNQLRALSEDGSVSQSRQALSLLPSLGDCILLPTSRCQLALERIAEVWHRRLSTHIGSETLDQVDTLMDTLDSLLDEKRIIQSQLDLNQASPLAPGATLSSLLNSIRNHRVQRLLELDKLVASIHEEIGKLTSTVSPSESPPQSDPEPSASVEIDIDLLESAFRSSFQTEAEKGGH